MGSNLRFLSIVSMVMLTAVMAWASAPTSYTAYGTGSGDHHVILADLDKDGDIDIASTAAIFNKMSVMLNNGNGTYASAVTDTTLNVFDINAAESYSSGIVMDINI